MHNRLTGAETLKRRNWGPRRGVEQDSLRLRLGMRDSVSRAHHSAALPFLGSASAIVVQGANLQRGTTQETRRTSTLAARPLNVRSMNQRVEAFARVSARKTFQRGCCLPGTVWQRGEPVVIDNLQNPTLFSRSSLARECGLEAGFGLPIRRGPEVAHVLVMLSAQATPLVRSFEAWVLEGNELRLDRSLGALGLRARVSSRPPRTRNWASLSSSVSSSRRCPWYSRGVPSGHWVLLT